MRIKAFAFVVGFILISCHTQKKQDFFDLTFQPKIIADNSTLAEGPAVDSQGNLYYSDQPGDKISKVTPSGEVSVYIHPAGVTNGIAFDNNGKMILCQSGSDNYPQNPDAALRRIVRIENSDSITVLADTYKNNRFIAPNDLCVDKKNRIYFTDPWYGNESVEKSQPVSGVYRIDSPGNVVLIISDLQRPNGILISPDQKKLFVSDRGTQLLHQYALAEDGSVQHEKVVYDFSPDRGIDGMCMDIKGNIYGAAGKEKTTGIYVINPKTNSQVAYYPFPETAFNLAFGGKDSKSLFVASGGKIYQLRTINEGIVLLP
ncbi:MAG: SMP-30/gluconolactonase/LRE family protein [Bacteroidota bacterium]